MNSIMKFTQMWMQPVRNLLLFTGTRFSIRQYCEEKINEAIESANGDSGTDNDKNGTGTRASNWEVCGHRSDESAKLTKTSASAQMAKGVDIVTNQEAPEPKQRMVELENVRSKINELDQRKQRHQEYVQMLKSLIVKPSTLQTEPKLPFKQPIPTHNLRQSLRNCTCVEEVLELTNDAELLASELVRLAWELSTEKRKHDIVLKNYLELKQEVTQSKSKSN